MYMCNRCDSTTQEADLAEDLVVYKKMFGCIHNLCYLGDTLDEDGEADLGTTAYNQVDRCISENFYHLQHSEHPCYARDDRVYASCLRISIIYRSTLPSWPIVG